MNNSPSVFKRFWNAVLFTRDLISVLLLAAALTVIAIIVVALRVSWPDPPVVESESTLVLDLSMPVVEGHEATAFPGFIQKVISNAPQQIRLYDILTSLNQAASDPKISQVAIVAPSAGSLGMAQAREISAAVEMFKDSSDKPVLAYGLAPSQAQYLVMAAADEVYLDPEGSLLLEGLSSFRPYFRSALVDKLGVDVHLFKVGQYKSAAEPFIRDDESPESRQASLFWMNDIWSRYLDDIARLRKTSSSKLRSASQTLANDIASSSGDLAVFAQDSGLVDGLLSDIEFHQRLSESGKWDPSTGTAVRIGVGSYASIRSGAFQRGQIALIPIQGEIVSGDPASGRASSSEVVQRLRKVANDPSIKAVVIRIDSPGGSVIASEVIRREVERLSESGRPVVVSMGNVAASGGYWIATASDTIVADPSTITGSIGIYGLLPNFTRALGKVGVNVDGVSTAPMAGALDPTRPLDPQAAKAMQRVIDNGYEKFLQRVSQARGLTMDQTDDIAQGRVWTGSQAMERNLVDRQGGLMTALLSAARQAGLDQKAAVVLYDGQSSGNSWRSSPQWASEFARQVMGIKTPLQYMGVSTPAWLEDALSLETSPQAKVYAHCLCVP